MMIRLQIYLWIMANKDVYGWEVQESNIKSIQN